MRRHQLPPPTPMHQVLRDQLEFLIDQSSRGVESAPEAVYRLGRVMRILLEPFETKNYSEVSIARRLRSR